MSIWSDKMNILFTINKFGILLIGLVFFLFIAIMIFLVLASAKKSFKKNNVEEDPIKKIKFKNEENIEEVFEKLKENRMKTEDNIIEDNLEEETYKEKIEEEKNAIKSVLEKMEKDLEKEKEGDIETFEREQEEKAIISYQELLKQAGKLRELTEDKKNQDLKKDIKIEEVKKEEKKEPEEHKKFKNTEFISPVYGKEAPESIINRKNQEFLNSLKDFRRNL